MKKWFLIYVTVAAIIWVLCYVVAYYSRISDSKVLMASFELFGTVLAFIGFLVLGGELFKFLRGFISVEDLKSFDKRIETKISGEFPVGKGSGRDGGLRQFDLFFCRDDAHALECLGGFYGKGKSWQNDKPNYFFQGIKGSPDKSGIKIVLDENAEAGPSLLCLSKAQRFKGDDSKFVLPDLFTETEIEIMRLIFKHSKYRFDDPQNPAPLD